MNPVISAGRDPVVVDYVHKKQTLAERNKVNSEEKKKVDELAEKLVPKFRNVPLRFCDCSPDDAPGSGPYPAVVKHTKQGTWSAERHKAFLTWCKIGEGAALSPEECANAIPKFLKQFEERSLTIDLKKRAPRSNDLRPLLAWLDDPNVVVDDD